MAVFPELVVTLASAFQPTATVPVPEVSLFSALAPMPIEPVPVVTAPSEEEPMAILSAPVPKEVPLPPTPASELTWFLVPTTLISAVKVDLATVFSIPLPSATTMLSELAPVCRPVMAIVLLALVTIVVGEPKVPPNFTSPLLAVSPLLALTSTGVAVVETPFTVDTRLPLVAVKMLLLMIDTAAAVTPLTEVVKLFALEVLFTVVLLFNRLGRSTDEVTPFTLEVSWPEATLKVLVVAAASAGARSKDAEVTPLIVVVNEEPDKVLFTVVLLFNRLGRSTDEVTPFTLEVSWPEATLKVLVVAAASAGARSKDAEVTPLIVVVNEEPANVLFTVVADARAEDISTGELLTPLTLVIRFLPLKLLLTVVAAASAGARSKDAEVTPLIVVVNEEPDKVLFTVVADARAEEISTGELLTPLTLVIRFLPLKLLLTVVAAASAGARSKDAEVTPLIVVVNEEPDKVLFTVVLLFNRLGRLTDEVTPFTLDVRLPEATLKVLVVAAASAGARSKDAELTPLIVVVSEEPAKVLFTVVLLFNRLGRLTDEVTPFTLDVS